jgi:hypothetical protein
VLQRTVVGAGNFSLTVRLWQDHGLSALREAAEVKVYAENSFVPHGVHANGDTRTLSYRVKKLSLIGAGGRELILFAGPKAWLFALALPVISLAKSLIINHRLYGKELWHTSWNLWRGLIRVLLGSLSRQY